MDDLKKLTIEEAAQFEQLVAAFTPITTTETPDYAELYFGEHRTQAMTMQPQDWLDFGKLLPKAVAAVNALPELLAKVKRLEADLQVIVFGWRYVAEPDNSFTKVDWTRDQLIEYARAALKETGQ